MLKSSYNALPDRELTGQYVVTFRKGTTDEGVRLLRASVGLKKLVRAADFPGRAVSVDQTMQDDGAIFDELDVCVVNCAKSAAERIGELAPRSAIIAVEPEHHVYALDESAVGAKVDDAGEKKGEVDQQPPHAASTMQRFIDSANESWGIQATGVLLSPYSGKGMDVVILDTGIDLQHPDLSDSNVVATKSFSSNDEIDDENGHGTHCAGTIFGPRLPASAPTYGVAPDANLSVGKILDKQGVGSDRSVLAGINWAVANRAHVISLSVGADVLDPSVAFEQVGQRALAAGTLIVAAAGNNSSRTEDEFGFVARPANNRSIMAVGAIDHQLQVADFSARSSRVTGGEVDLVGPGVDVFSAWTLPMKYQAVSGTSMATPFVAGIAALYAEAYGIRGLELWKRMVENAQSLPDAGVDVGAGLIQAPIGSS